MLDSSIPISTLDQLAFDLDPTAKHIPANVLLNKDSPMHSRNHKTYVVGKTSYTVFGKPLVEPRYNPFTKKTGRAADEADKVLGGQSQSSPMVSLQRPPNSYGVKLNTVAEKKSLTQEQSAADPSCLYLVDNGSETSIPNVIPSSSANNTDDEWPEKKKDQKNKKNRGVVGKYTHKQRIIEQYRKQLWKKLRQHEEMETQAKVREEHLQSVEELEKEYEMKILLLTKERDDNRLRAQGLQRDVRDLHEQVKVLKDRVVELQKLDTDTHKKLQAAAEFERTYALISSTFDYGSPEEAVNNIDTLYHHNTTLQAQLQAAQMQCDDLEKKSKTQQLERTEELEEQRIKITELLFQSHNAESKVTEQTKAIDEMSTQLSRLKDADKKYSKLSQAVSDWFYNWKMRIVQFHGQYFDDDDSSMQVAKDDPMSMVTVLIGWADQFHPSRAGLLYKEIFDIAMKTWSAVFSKEDSIRGIPKKIFQRLLELCQAQQKEISTFNSQITLYKEEAKHSKKEMDELKREHIRRAHAHHPAHGLPRTTATSAVDDNNVPLPRHPSSRPNTPTHADYTSVMRSARRGTTTSESSRADSRERECESDTQYHSAGTEGRRLSGRQPGSMSARGVTPRGIESLNQPLVVVAGGGGGGGGGGYSSSDSQQFPPHSTYPITVTTSKVTSSRSETLKKYPTLLSPKFNKTYEVQTARLSSEKASSAKDTSTGTTVSTIRARKQKTRDDG